MSTIPEISIVIPVRNEEQTIASVLRSLSAQDDISVCQVIVVDGGSTDGTADIAAAFPFVHIISTAPGLVSQMNEGASQAQADILWFLHADSTLPHPGIVSLVIDTMRNPTVSGGACRFRLRANDSWYTFIAALVNLRARVLHRPYGDQGIFVRRTIFETVGGYREIACADVDLALRVREWGTFQLIDAVVETSARTWRQHGKLKTTAWHLKEWLAYEWTRRRRRPAAPPPPLGHLPPSPVSTPPLGTKFPEIHKE